LRYNSGEYTLGNELSDTVNPQYPHSHTENKVEQKYTNIIKRVLKKIVPSDIERREIERVATETLEKVKKILHKNISEPFLVEIHGSLAKDTWLSSARDIDIFVFFKKKLRREDLKKIVEIIGEKLKYSYELRFAEHPYIHLRVKNFEIDVVPGFFTDKVESPIDRSPYHTRFINEMLTDLQKDQVRLLKAFLRGINCYGAEIKIGGFSGYLCELLILAFGNFINTLKQISKQREIFIDFTHSWSKKRAMFHFKSPMIIIDPVDRNRNAAAAVKIETLNRIRFFAKLFLEKPSLSFFFPSKLDIPEHLLLNELQTRNIILVVLSIDSVVEDIYWGQGLRVVNKLRNHLIQHGFRVINIKAWDIQGYFVIGVELVEKDIKICKIVGPPIYCSSEHLIRFLVKHKKIWLNRGRIFTIKSKTINAREIIEETLKKLKLKPSFTEFKVITNPSEILEFARKTNSIEKLSEFLFGEVIRFFQEYFECKNGM